MATNVTVKDLENYPTVSKTVSVDQSTVVPVGAEGDEKWVISFTTSAYSNNTDRTAIQDIYIRQFKAGWFKSSGLSGGPFVIGGSNKCLGVSIDGSDVYYIELNENIYSGDNLAATIEEKIRILPTTSGIGWNANDDASSFQNAVVDYANGKLSITSGNLGSYYIGENKSSVIISTSGSDTLYSYVGFNLGYNSESIAGTSIYEGLLTVSCVSGTEYISTGLSSSDVTVGDCVVITDNTNTDYFSVMGVNSEVLTVPTVSGGDGIDGIKHDYTADAAKVQVLRIQDPDGEPKMYHNTVDSIIRWGIATLANSIDFSS